LSKKSETCYLCGELLEEEISRDHWPPSQFFPKNLRKKHKPNALITLPSHIACNKKIELDEEYFYVSLAPLSEDPYIQKAIHEDLKRKFKDPRKLPLYRMVEKEFRETTDAGLYYPAPKLTKKFNRKRVENVIWKIVRGLYFYETGSFLPEKSDRYIRVIDPQQSHPKEVSDLFELVKSRPEKGNYGRLFAYKILKSDPVGIYTIGFIFWNQVMFFVMFHGPECVCKTCKPEHK
jgi:hypothetical protein